MQAALAVGILSFVLAWGGTADPPTTLPTASSQPVGLHLRPIPDVRALPARAVTQPATAAIQQLITDLARIDKPMLGVSPTIAGTEFSPLPGFSNEESMILMDHELKSAGALRELVALGPAALPHVLKSLTDRRPTELTVEWDTFIGVMSLERELPINPLNDRERAAIASLPDDSAADFDRVIKKYTVKVGDVCFVAIGQMVGRQYMAVRYQPSGCVVVNSPTEDANLAEAVRSVWSSDDPRQRLLDSLLRDYHTASATDDDGDQWYVASDLQTAAATRLLYYYPRESRHIVRNRLRALNVAKIGPSVRVAAREDEMERWWRREESNGVRTDEFVKAVAWCAEPEIRGAVRRIFVRSDDPDIVLAALPAIDPSEAELIIRRLDGLLRAVSVERDGTFGSAFQILVALGDTLGERSKPVFERWLRKGGVRPRMTMCYVLRRTMRDWAAEMLAQLLDDRRETDLEYSPNENQPDVRLPLRICDLAAETLAQTVRGAHFALRGPHAELDRQIQAVKEAVLKSHRAKRR